MHPVLVFLFAGWTFEYLERENVFRQAKTKADEVGKPLLNAGCDYYWTAIYGSDVNLDNVPRDVPRFVLANIEAIPYPDKYFGAAFCSHVLEHVDDYEKALAELHRVAYYIYVITPLPTSAMNWLHPGHKRFFVGDKVYVRATKGWEISNGKLPLGQVK
jgi:SAM-dependent methyltransferase